VIRAQARREQELHRIVDDVKSALTNLEDAHQRIRHGDLTDVGKLYDSARDQFNQAAVAFESWLKTAPNDRQMMLYRAVVIRILTSTRMLVDTVPHLTNSNRDDTDRASDIIDIVSGQIAQDFALLRDMPAALRSPQVFVKAGELDEKLAADWEEKIGPVRADIAGLAPQP
jgi:hypothetical protein